MSRLGPAQGDKTYQATLEDADRDLIVFYTPIRADDVAGPKQTARIRVTFDPDVLARLAAARADKLPQFDVTLPEVEGDKAAVVRVPGDTICVHTFVSLCSMATS